MSFAWSWSALDSFETCPKKHWHPRVKKDTVDPPNDASLWGNRVHKAMADRISKARPLPAEMPYEKHIDVVLQNSDRTKVLVMPELQLAVTDDMTPCKYFDKEVDPWLRVVVDLLKVNAEARIARQIDWKTGAGKFYTDPVTGKNVADSDQLRLSAAVIFAIYPHIDVVWSQYFWMQEDVVTDEYVTRADLPAFWSRVLPRVERMEYAFQHDEYPAKPSGLCVKHCPVTSCPYHGRGSR